MSAGTSPLVLVTGATGYVGGRLVPRLVGEGHRVRVLVRDAARLHGREWLRQVEVAVGDVAAPGALREALAGVKIAYYLVHGMSDSPDYAERDLAAARAFGSAARSAGVERIVFLGGLGDPASDLSPHLRSRQATGAALAEAGVPVTEFRAAVIVGSGSLSFEIVRNLTERLPAMICPKWVYVRHQPISIEDVVSYLAAAPRVPGSAGRIVEIGGADVLTYRDLILGYAKVRGLRRALVPVPVLTPRLSSYWVHWTTPVPASIARPLIEGLRNEVVVRDDTARRLFPDISPMTYADAVRRALAGVEGGSVETRWSDALQSSQRDRRPAVLEFREGMFIDRRRVESRACAAALFRVFTGLGGARGWLVGNALWRTRGRLDRMLGGVGLRRGRRDPDRLRVGDAVDFWRVEAIEPNRLLRLRAEMKLPGSAWLQFEVSERSDGSAVLTQTAAFAPRGLVGLLYWYALYPVHAVMFDLMAKRIADRALHDAPGTIRRPVAANAVRGLDGV